MKTIFPPEIFTFQYCKTRFPKVVKKKLNLCSFKVILKKKIN